MRECDPRIKVLGQSFSAVRKSSLKSSLKNNGEKRKAPLRLSAVRQKLLLYGSDDVLGGLGHTELDNCLGLDLDGCASLWVAANAGLALCLHETADAGDHEDAIL